MQVPNRCDDAEFGQALTSLLHGATIMAEDDDNGIYRLTRLTHIGGTLSHIQDQDWLCGWFNLMGGIIRTSQVPPVVHGPCPRQEMVEDSSGPKSPPIQQYYCV